MVTILKSFSYKSKDYEAGKVLPSNPFTKEEQLVLEAYGNIKVEVILPKPKPKPRRKTARGSKKDVVSKNELQTQD